MDIIGVPINIYRIYSTYEEVWSQNGHLPSKVHVIDTLL